jgi:hypothetical protein
MLALTDAFKGLTTAVEGMFAKTQRSPFDCSLVLNGTREVPPPPDSKLESEDSETKVEGMYLFSS